MHFDRRNGFQNAHKYIFPEKRIIFAYPFKNFLTHYPKHTCFFIWPKCSQTINTLVMHTSIWWCYRVLPVLHRPEVVDIGANIIYRKICHMP